MEPVKIGGIYVHFKDPEHRYRVIAIGKNDQLEDVVIYQTLYKNDLSEYWTRPVDHFIDHIDREGYSGPRFRLLEDQN